jgi:hypothetical protein
VSKYSFGFRAAIERGEKAQERVEEVFDDCRLRAMHETATFIRDAITRQSLPLEPDSPKTIRYKLKHGLHEQTLMATGKYVRNIQLWRDPNGFEYVGVPDMPHVRGEDLSMKELSLWLEFGARSPPRPHLEPGRRFLQTRLQELLAEAGFRIKK